MATTTTNFGWDIPQSTDLVKDGATAIATLGQDIDTAFVDLKGGTTGQILSKNSNTDLDYVWVANQVGDITAVTAGTGLTGGGTSGDVTLTLDSTAVIAPTTLTTKGDLLVRNTTAPTRLGVGTDAQVLTADSTAATGVKWATPAGATGPTFYAYKSAGTQTVTQQAWTKVTFTSETWDSDNCFASSAFTPTKAGYYQINANIGAESSTRIALYKNGAEFTRGNGYDSNDQLSVSSLVSANGSTDYFEIYVYANNSTQAIYSGASYTNFNGIWIRGL